MWEVAFVLWMAVMLSSASARSQTKPRDEPQPGFGGIQGQVLGEKGEPLASAKVSIRPEKGAFLGMLPTVYTDAEGSYYFDRVKPGSYVVVAEKEGDGYPNMDFDFYNPHPLSQPYPIVKVEEGEITRSVSIKLGPKAGRFKGRVVDEVTGEPVRSASMQFLRPYDLQHYYLSFGLRWPQLSFDKLVPTKRPFLMFATAPGYEECWVGEKGCQDQPNTFELSSPVTEEFLITLRRTKGQP